jgi:hypothetical protein
MQTFPNRIHHRDVGNCKPREALTDHLLDSEIVFGDETTVQVLKESGRAAQTLSCFGPIRQHFALKRHLLRALLCRKQLAARFVAWRDSPKSPKIRPTRSEGRFPAVFSPQSRQVDGAH